MPRQTVVQNNFNNGEISPKAKARFDYEKYPNSLKLAQNVILNQLGGAQFCPGLRYVAENIERAFGLQAADIFHAVDPIDHVIAPLLELIYHLRHALLVAL